MAYHLHHVYIINKILCHFIFEFHVTRHLLKITTIKSTLDDLYTKTKAFIKYIINETRL